MPIARPTAPTLSGVLVRCLIGARAACDLRAPRTPRGLAGCGADRCGEVLELELAGFVRATAARMRLLELADVEGPVIAKQRGRGSDPGDAFGLRRHARPRIAVDQRARSSRRSRSAGSALEAGEARERSWRNRAGRGREDVGG